MKRRITEGINESWISDTNRKIEKGARRRGGFERLGMRAKPRIRALLRKTRKDVAARYFQLLSGHAMIAPFLNDKWGWTDSDECWWCEDGKQSRDHLFKECRAWEHEINELWSTVGRISGKREEGDGPFKSRRGFGFHVR